MITYPPVKQDLAFVVDETVQAGDLVAAAREAAAATSCTRSASSTSTRASGSAGPGRSRSRCHVAFRSPERTLTDEDAAGLRGRIVAELERRFGAELRA